MSCILSRRVDGKVDQIGKIPDVFLLQRAPRRVGVIGARIWYLCSRAVCGERKRNRPPRRRMRTTLAIRITGCAAIWWKRCGICIRRFCGSCASSSRTENAVSVSDFAHTVKSYFSPLTKCMAKLPLAAVYADHTRGSAGA